MSFLAPFHSEILPLTLLSNQKLLLRESALTSLKVPRDVSLLVGLDNDVEVSTIVVSGGRSVGSSDDLLSDGSLNLDVLSDGESKDSSRRGERESVAVRKGWKVGELERLWKVNGRGSLSSCFEGRRWD